MPDRDKVTKRTDDLRTQEEIQVEMENLLAAQLEQFRVWEYTINSADNGWVVDVRQKEEGSEYKRLVFSTFDLLKWLAHEFGIDTTNG